jgi:hypothetical protein
MVNKMNFKVGIARYIKGMGWSYEYRIVKLLPDSTLSEITNDDTIMEAFGMREDQPEYNFVMDYTSLVRAMEEKEEDFLF